MSNILRNFATILRALAEGAAFSPGVPRVLQGLRADGVHELRQGGVRSGAQVRGREKEVEGVSGASPDPLGPLLPHSLHGVFWMRW